MGIMAWIPFELVTLVDGEEVVVLVDDGPVVESKKEYCSNLKLQLGTITLPPCVPLQHCGTTLIATSKQLMQFCRDNSGVHCTNAYNGRKSRVPPRDAYLRRELPAAASFVRLLSNELRSSLN